jgi:uncharacterized protein DUF6929
MDRRSSELEDLPPLELRELRALNLAEAPGPDKPPHVSSASGVARRGDFVYVIGDDLLHLGVFRLSDPAPGALRRVLPAATDDPDAKPDLEALTVLPPFAEHPYGALMGLGSGSGPNRDRGFVIAFSADGSLRGEPTVIYLGPLYRLLGERIDGLNVEGACVMGDRLWLLHRGNRGSMTNVVAELSLEHVMGSITGDGTIEVHELQAIRAYDLGRLDDIELTFSDATPLGDRLIAFTASAEAAPETSESDRKIRGSVVGTIDLDGHVQRLRTIDRRFKVEGVHASVDTGVMDFLFVCDQDDPETASPLLSAAMPADGGVERPGG